MRGWTISNRSKGRPLPVPAGLFIAPSPTGNDANAGTQASPFATFNHADSVVTTGQTVTVMDGTYAEAIVLTTSHVTWKAQNKWGAKIAPPAAGIGPSHVMIQVGGTAKDTWVFPNSTNNITLDGFDINGALLNAGQAASGVYATCNGVVVRNCRVRNMALTDPARTFALGGNGGAGIVFDGYYGNSGGTMENNVIGNMGPYNPATSLIHGLYCATSGLRVQNNLIYNVPSGDGVTSWHGASSLIIANNTVFNCNDGVALGGSYDTGANYPISYNDNTKVFNNIICNNAGYGVVQAPNAAFTAVGSIAANKMTIGVPSVITGQGADLGILIWGTGITYPTTITAFDSSTGTGSIPGASTTLTVTVAPAVPIALGQAISGTNVTPGTTISAFGTGSGGTGTYTVSSTPIGATGSITITFTATGGAGRYVVTPSQTASSTTINGSNVGPNSLVDHNLNNNNPNGDLLVNITATNQLAGDPTFTNYDAAGPSPDGAGVYTILNWGPPIDAGISSLTGTLAPTAASDGTARPVGATFDMGIYEQTNTGPQPQTWDPAKSNTHNALSALNLTVTTNANTVLSTTLAKKSVTTGKLYWETVHTFGTNSWGGVGIANTGTTVADNTQIGDGTDSVSYEGVLSTGLFNNNVNVVVLPTYVSGSRICHALDMTNHKYWVRVGAAGNWNNDVIGNQNPATNTGGYTLPAAVYASPVVPGCTLYNSGAGNGGVNDHVDGVFAAASWVGTAPAGFGAF